MPRINLSISDDLYAEIQKAAAKKNISVNYAVCEMLEERFGKKTTYDYTAAINQMIIESKKMKKDFTLADLPTFGYVDEVVRQYKIKQSPAAIRARLGKLYNEAVRKGTAKGIKRATVKRNGVEEFKFYSRAAVYTNS